MVSVVVYGTPVPKARARTVRMKNGRHVTFTPDKSAAWENKIQAAALESRPKELLDGPLVLEVTFYLQRPKSKPKRVRFPDTKPDLDNLVKSVKDALEGIVYANDSRIVDEVARKRYGDPPRVEVTIRPAERLGGVSS
jgi:Holliday junction resolvase RusA-like endonuclease